MIAATDLAAVLEQVTGAMYDWVWSTPLFLLLLGCGLIFTVASRFAQWRILSHGYACIRGHYDKPGDTGHINHFQALCAALSATIGLGNIAGVAVAVSVGGPGAVFWMWVVGLFGMALKFMECTLAVMFRDVRDVPDPSAPALIEQDAEQRTLEYEGGAPAGSGRAAARPAAKCAAAPCGTCRRPSLTRSKPRRFALVRLQDSRRHVRRRDDPELLRRRKHVPGLERRQRAQRELQHFPSLARRWSSRHW